jgi:hypothetical protein
VFGQLGFDHRRIVFTHCDGVGHEGYGRLLAERGGLLPSFPLEGPYRMDWAMRATRGMRERFDGVAESGESTTGAGCGRLMLHAVDATAG